MQHIENTLYEKSSIEIENREDADELMAAASPYEF